MNLESEFTLKRSSNSFYLPADQPGINIRKQRIQIVMFTIKVIFSDSLSSD